MTNLDRRAFAVPRRVHPLSWVWEPLESDPTLVVRPMFGTRAVYLGGRMMLCCCSGEEPWRGILVCTSREHHDALRQQFPALRPHPVLGKWLYLPENAPDFELSAQRITELARARDPRLGITPGTRGARKRRTAVSGSPKRPRVGPRSKHA